MRYVKGGIASNWRERERNGAVEHGVYRMGGSYLGIGALTGRCVRPAMKVHRPGNTRRSSLEGGEAPKKKGRGGPYQIEKAQSRGILSRGDE